MSSITEFSGYAIQEIGGKADVFTFEAPSLQEDDITVKVTHCGICYSDIHMSNSAWFPIEYPFVGGHEIVGEVVEVGPSVRNLKKGQRVGVGWVAKSCLSCEQCRKGKDQYCVKRDDTIVFRHGGWANYVRVNSHMAFPIPEGLASESAAPLLCAGITVFHPLKKHAEPGKTVGIVGIGGLGHLAIQFANKMGYKVIGFSSSSEKEADMKQLGAHTFVNMKDESQMKKAYGTCDLILLTGTPSVKVDGFIDVLKTEGTLHLLEGGPSFTNLSGGMLLGQGKSISASSGGSRDEIFAMLSFAALHGIKPIVQLCPFSKINEAIKQLVDGKARYRLVLHH